MNAKWFPILLIVLALVFSGLDAVYFYSRLPQQVASHFDAHGWPDGWSSKQQFIGLALGTLLFMTVVLVPISFVAYVAPPALISLPNKAYWLSPQHEAETRRAIADWGLWFAGATLWFLAMVFYQSMAANLQQPPQMRSIWWILGIFMAVVVGMVLQLIIRFGRTPRH